MTRTYWNVDIPRAGDREWEDVATADTREQAIEIARELFGADAEGKVCLISEIAGDEDEAETPTLDVEALREQAHREYEIAKLMGPSDDPERFWLVYLRDLLQVTDAYLDACKARGWVDGITNGAEGEAAG